MTLKAKIAESRKHDLIVDAIENGIRGGLMRCEKYDYLSVEDKLAEDAVNLIHRYVMDALYEEFEELRVE